jgi:hypothetical protein
MNIFRNKISNLFRKFYCNTCTQLLTAMSIAHTENGNKYNSCILKFSIRSAIGNMKHIIYV